jgi:hypothetical protein
MCRFLIGERPGFDASLCGRLPAARTLRSWSNLLRQWAGVKYCCRQSVTTALKAGIVWISTIYGSLEVLL